MPARAPKKLSGISPRAWEHPTDRAALNVLRRTGGLEEIIKLVAGGTTEKAIRLLHVAGSVKVTETQFPKVRQMLARVAEVMDRPTLPDVFVSNNPFFNAGVMGVKEPFIVLNSAVVKMLDDDELCCVIGHEMGHIMSGHQVYMTVLWVLLQLSASVLPVAGLLVKPLVLALKEWERASELSADRAALLSLQSEQENYNVLMKAAGGGDLSQMNANDFFRQAWEYESQKTVVEGVIKMLNTVGQSHPFPVVRLQELHTWAVSGEYAAILAGNYPRRGDAPVPITDDLKDGWNQYSSSVQRGNDPLAKTVRDVGDSLGKAAESLRDALKDFLNR